MQIKKCDICNTTIEHLPTRIRVWWRDKKDYWGTKFELCEECEGELLLFLGHKPITSEVVNTPTTLKEEMKKVKESARKEKHRPDYIPNLTQQSLDGDK